ncbi:hypothetical protein TRVL_09233 [Trypanosoma vivax]|nr:hypothetical protein TRVL_09233 [Trypanosoma vivax]
MVCRVIWPAPLSGRRATLGAQRRAAGRLLCASRPGRDAHPPAHRISQGKRTKNRRAPMRFRGGTRAFSVRFVRLFCVLIFVRFAHSIDDLCLSKHNTVLKFVRGESVTSIDFLPLAMR